MSQPPETTPTPEPKPFAGLSRWLDMIDEILATEPNTPQK